MTKPVALFFALFALPLIVWPYHVAKVDEMTDAIGTSRGMHRVEPAAWKVALTRYAGVGWGLVCVAWFFLGG